jgi:hydroxymethylpyrimidine pyrophosphatase-like HAD family hydrolase
MPCPNNGGINKAMLLLACDLDNTLIHKKYTPGDICIEYAEGKEKNFMSVTVCKALEHLDERICLVPVTGRSLAQYKRIDFFEKHVPQYAITSCGGILLRQGEIDRLWQMETEAIIQESAAPMRSMLNRLMIHPYISFVKMVDDIFIVAQSDKPYEVMNLLLEIAGTTIEVFNDNDRIYVIPRAINKGIALQKLRNQLDVEYVISAGDSVVDIPMLRVADIALVPTQSIADMIPAHHSIYPCYDQENDFADFIVKYACLAGDKHRT